jgi:methyltransferase (TIGR00027 family)
MPNLSSSLHVGRLRYIQFIHESPERRNPDTLVKHFFPLVERCRLRWLSGQDLSQLRADPFYYYLVARTKYYDQVFCDAISGGVRQILNIGCGTDTRSHRFKASLRSNNVIVLECDQPEAIVVKERLTGPWGRLNRIEYSPVDLNDGEWSAVAHWLQQHAGVKTLVMMEGVSPYVNDEAFGRFLQFLRTTLTPGSQVAYDFKFRGIVDGFGRGGPTVNPFRQPPARDEIAAFHEARGFRLESFESSSDLSVRLLPGIGKAPAALFKEDGLVRLLVNGH